MSGHLQDEISQARPFESLEIEAFLNVMRTADLLQQQVDQVLKTSDLSFTQYNVLRILRGALPDGLPCSKIGARMVTHDPDITRLLDRMEQRHLVARERSREDRRVVVVTITKPGIEALELMAEPVKEAHRRQFQCLGAERLRLLIDLLESIRAAGHSEQAGFSGLSGV